MINSTDLHRNIGDEKRLHCNWCKVRTTHQLKAFHRSPTEWLRLDTMDVIDGEEWDEESDDGYVEYRLWFCKGCDTGVLEIVYNEGEPFAPTAEYCPPLKLHGVTTKEFIRLPPKLTAIYGEVIKSFNYELNTLCAIGLRALLEGICEDKGMKGKNLQGRIDGLKALLPENIVNSLHSFRFIGNEAAHKLESPNSYNLKLCIEVVEDLLNYLYELEYKVSRLPKRRQSP